LSGPRQDVIDDAYGEEVLRAMDVLEREDFYGIVAAKGLRFFGEKLRLTQKSHLLDLGSGIGGPARYLAGAYGCRVTGVDLSEFNHRTAEARTKAARLDGRLRFIQGDMLAMPLPAGSFSHVFGCEAWCYFADKAPLYAAAHHALEPGGIIAFLEAACEEPVRLRTEELLGPVRYESVARYAGLLEAAGFRDIQHFDTTALASADISAALYRLITRRSKVIEAAGEEVYFGLLELWAEFLAYFAEGRMTHCGFIARKA
jgi:SAM-dependent methyltransferase